MMNKLFVKAIKGLLDDTNLFTRTQWANLLDVSNSEINRWLSEKDIPRSDHLTMIYSILTMQENKVPQEPISFFKEIANCPADKVSKYGNRMLPTVWEYMQKPVVEWS